MINKLYPGKENYTGPQKGYFTLLHHAETLIEWSDNVTERIDYIKKEKSVLEVPIRLRHIVYVPMKMVPHWVRKADAEWQKAYAEWQWASDEWRKADAQAEKAHAEAGKAYTELRKADAEWRKASDEAEKVYAEAEKAYAEWRKADREKLLAYLHKHVKDCKWNGVELVFNG